MVSIQNNSKNIKIIIMPGSGVGDCIALLSALHVLKQHKDNVIIDAVIQGKTPIELFRYNPNIRYLHIDPNKNQLSEIRNNYDFVIAFPVGGINTEYLKYLSLKTVIPEYGDKPHLYSAFNMIKFIFCECSREQINKYYIFPQSHHIEKAKEIMLQSNISLTDKKILIGCHIGYSSIAYKGKSFFRRVRGKFGSRAWALKNYVLLLDKLIKHNSDIRFVLTGSEAEIKIIAKLFKRHSKYIYNVSGKTSLLELACIMQYFKCFVSGDTGPMHIAAAMNVSLVTLFPEKTFAMGRIPFANQCAISSVSIDDITVEQVFDAIVDVINDF